MEFIQQIFSQAQDVVSREPFISLALAAALAAVMITTLTRARENIRSAAGADPWRSLGTRAAQFVRSAVLVVALVGVVFVLKNYLNGAVAEFRRTHGRVSEANYDAVQTIWGPEQNQQELTAQFGYDEEVTERTEFDDPDKPAIIKKTIEHRAVACNPFVSARHEITLRQNPRRKGSAIYPGYQTQCRFTYKLAYTGDHDAQATLRFPLPSAAMVCNDLSVTLNGQSVLDRLQVSDGALVLALDAPKGWTGDLDIRFNSRGVSFWYFQITEARVIRDFALTLHLPDLPKDRLNYPEGCMTPTVITPTADGRGCDLVYQLENAVSSKGMGIALSQPAQPGTTMNAVLTEASTAWTLLFAAVLSALTLAGAPRAILLSVLLGAATAFGYGLLGNFHDILFGFWGSAAVILAPLLLFLGWLLARAVPGPEGNLIGLLPLVFGGLYPCLAGMDPEREMLYLNVCAALLLALTAWQILRRTSNPKAPAPDAAFHAAATTPGGHRAI